ncbi:MAG: PQQ-binding-like beta-propeller repeat protein [Pseudomonadota bacterium]
MKGVWAARCMGVLGLLVLGACGEQELILEGQREELRAILGEEVAPEPLNAGPVTLPAPAVARAWTHQAGAPDHNPGHVTLAANPRQIWSTSIGAGDKRRFRIAAQPVSDGTRIYAMDSRSVVTAVSTAGDVLWQTNLTPPTERAESAAGGGLAVAGGRVYATTGFGTLVALDATSGAEIWSHNFQSIASGAPTAAGGLVYAVTRNGIGWALDTSNGRVRWTVPGLSSAAGILGGPSPAVTADGLAVFAFPSGEVAAVDAATGAGRWRGIIAGQRLEPVASGIADVTGDPVIAGNIVLAGTHGGRSAAFDRLTGQELWLSEEGAMAAPAVAGGAAFQVTDRNALIRVDLATGATVWSTPLPLFRTTRPRRFDALFAHFGPILAGGRLVVASDDGALRFFNPSTGALMGEVPLPGGAASDPIVVAGTLYVVTEAGRLVAFR